jgi:putative tryptophan/tyrosine transport system substrate-binding protein
VGWLQGFCALLSGPSRIKAAGGSVVAWPLAVRAQQPDRVRRIAYLTTTPEMDPEHRSWIMAFAQRLQDLGWIDGRNIRIDYRFGTPDAIQRLAAELLELQPDAIVAAGSPASVELRRRTRTIPVIFLQTGDPIEMGLVKNLAHPEGNVTGFIQFESTMRENGWKF